MTEQIFKDPTQLVFIQSRAATNYELIDEYAAMMKAGVQFDAAQGVRDENDRIYVWDGLHRGEAARLAGEQLLVNVHLGSRQDAEWLALTANQKHGLRRSRADVQRIIRQALSHSYGLNLSDREIARHCGVDHKTVGRVRQELELSGEIPQIAQRTVIRNGQSYQQDTRNIGSAQQKQGQVNADTSELSQKLSTLMSYAPLLPEPQPKTTSAYPGLESKAQEFQCPRCGREEIVGINGSRRWCLHCGAEWPTMAAFLAEAQVRLEPDLGLLSRENLQNRFLNILSHLDQQQLSTVNTWLDELECQLLPVDCPQDITPQIGNLEAISLIFNQAAMCLAASPALIQVTQPVLLAIR